MRDTVYIPFILFRPTYIDSYFGPLVEAIKNISTPAGVEIISVERFIEPLTQRLLQLINSLNTASDFDPVDVIEEPEYLIRLEIESDNQIRFTEMPWLEEQINLAIDQVCRTVGFYYFYLIDGGNKFKSCNIAKLMTDDGFDYMINVAGDDMTILIEAAPYLSHYWYRNDEVNVAKAFPAETAKYLLLFDI